MLVDWKIKKDGDSGIYLRGSPQVQIWDPAVKAANGVGSGGLYNNKKNPDKPLVTADNPVGEWNTFRIKMVGEKVSVWLNGKLVMTTSHWKITGNAISRSTKPGRSNCRITATHFISGMYLSKNLISDIRVKTG